MHEKSSVNYRRRVIESKLQEYLSFFSVVGITGPRQSGKSTLLENAVKGYSYVNFDDIQLVNLFHQDPEKFMRENDNKVIFDEVQRVPEIFRYIKMAVDKDRQTPGKFILTGSSQFGFIKGVTESLAGRIGLLSLLPYQFSEMPASRQKESVYRGGYPELVNKQYQLSDDWFSAYVDTYLERDIRSLANIGDLRDFHRLIQLLAANTSQILNMSRFASDIGVDVKTIKRWISILEASYIVFLLPPFYENYGKRIVKRPKLYFYDTGLVSYLVGIKNEELYNQGPMMGSLFENYVIAEILKRELHQKTHADLYYLRTGQGEEVDLIIDRKHTRRFIEIKSSETFRPKMLEALNKFVTKDADAYLLYNGRSLSHVKSVQVLHYRNYLI